MSDIDDDESCFDPTECSAEREPPHDDAGVETGGWEDEPVQAGSRASAFPIMKTDPPDIPFQSAFDRFVAAIRETLPQRYCYL